MTDLPPIVSHVKSGAKQQPSNAKNRMIYCCGCAEKVEARLTSGKEIYPNRSDLHALPFWKCDTCRNYVGCHHKTGNPTQPLGNIPTPELRRARGKIHEILDFIYASGKIPRTEIYKRISDALGYRYHSAQIRTIDEARNVYLVIKGIANG